MTHLSEMSVAMVNPLGWSNEGNASALEPDDDRADSEEGVTGVAADGGACGTGDGDVARQRAAAGPTVQGAERSVVIRKNREVSHCEAVVGPCSRGYRQARA